MKRISNSKQIHTLAEDWLFNVKIGAWSFAQARTIYSRSYRKPIIRQRAAKRFGRLVRKYHVVENPAAVERWENYKHRHNEFFEVLTGDYRSY